MRTLLKLLENKKCKDKLEELVKNSCEIVCGINELMFIRFLGGFKEIEYKFHYTAHLLAEEFIIAANEILDNNKELLKWMTERGIL